MEIQETTGAVSFEQLTGFLNPETKADDSSKKDFFSHIDNDISTDNIIVPTKETKTTAKVEDEEVIEEVIPDKDTPDAEIIETTTEDIVQSIVADNKTKPDTTSLKGLDSIYKELIKDEVLVGFSDDKPVESVEELKLLIQENMKMERQKVIDEELPQFVESLPDEVQALVKYATEGGKDFKGMFKALAEVEEFKQIEVKETDKKGQRDTAFKYLKATNFAKGNEEKINEIIDEWEDNGTLFKKAKEFKPELDEMSEKLVAQKLQEQELKAREQEKRNEQQKELVYESIVKDNNLNGIKLDKQTQGKLFAGLTQRHWKSQDGTDREIDALDAIIEHYKYTKPDYKLLAEALYLLSNPTDYKKKLASEIKQKTVGETVRTLRTEESRRGGGNEVASEGKVGIKRTSGNNSFWNNKK
jgi:hypothetical protein